MNALFIVGRVARAGLVASPCKRTRWGLIVRTVGESAEAARAMGYDVNRVRTLATMAGGFLAGVGGSFLSLFYPGSWNEGLSSGQGLMAVALVIFARWNPVRCLLGLAAVRRRERARSGAASGGRDSGLLPVQRRAVRAHAGDHDPDQLARPQLCRAAGRADRGPMSDAENIEIASTPTANPYPWPCERRSAPRKHRADRHRHAD